MVSMTCAEHDKLAEDSQFITHPMGWVLEKLGLETPPINTKGYETLLNLVENAASDSFEPLTCPLGCLCTIKMLWRSWKDLDLAFEALKELFGHLQDLTAPSSDAIKSQNN